MPLCAAGVPITRSSACAAGRCARAPAGDIAELCKFIGAGPALTARLVERRTQIVSKSWCRHSLFGERAKRLLETWLQNESNDALSEAAE